MFLQMSWLPEDIKIEEIVNVENRTIKYHAGYYYDNAGFYDLFCGIFPKEDSKIVEGKTELDTHDFCIKCLGKLINLI